MLSILPGIGILFTITVVAGGIAYIGDRVGHQVGRKRLTLFGLRPKYTSTIVAVATGMLIALSVTLVALIASSYVRTAFFRIGQLSSEINTLQAQAAQTTSELKTTRSKNLVLPNFAEIAPYFAIDPRRPEDEQLRAISLFFDETVRYVNATYANPRAGLAPYKNSSSEASIRANLLEVLRSARKHEEAAGDTGVPIIFVPVASSNLFRGETISFGFPSWADKKLFASGEEVASIEVEGGKTISNADYQALVSRSFDRLAGRQFPAPFFNTGASGIDPTRFNQASAELARVRGRFRLVSRSETDIYPHTGGFILSVSIEPLR